jgi:mannose-6-phosphate isomerase-like protein (cupin superfamily)
VDPLDQLFAEADIPLRATVADAHRAPIEANCLSARLMQHGSMHLRWYSPGQQDRQNPHDRDEVYIVVTGRAKFIRARAASPLDDQDLVNPAGYDRIAVGPGDALFVPAGTEHRFEDLTADFGAWIIFYGPEGGERG